MERILIVDDEPSIRMVLSGVLTNAGYQVDSVDSGEAALEQLLGFEYDLLLVDLQMAGLDGLTLIDQARASHPDLAMIILTGFASTDSAIQALRQGVDDYLVKPARPDEIRAAVRRVLARRRTVLEKTAALIRIARDLQHVVGEAELLPRTTESPIIQRGPLIVDETAHRAAWHGQLLTLTPIEFGLLTYLARHMGKALSPQVLVLAVQGYECSAPEARELIKPHIYSLRAKIEPDPANPRYLINLRGVGYILQLDE